MWLFRSEWPGKEQAVSIYVGSPWHDWPHVSTLHFWLCLLQHSFMCCVAFLSKAWSKWAHLVMPLSWPSHSEVEIYFISQIVQHWPSELSHVHGSTTNIVTKVLDDCKCGNKCGRVFSPTLNTYCISFLPEKVIVYVVNETLHGFVIIIHHQIT